ARHLPQGSVADRRRPHRTRHGPPHARLPEDRPGLKDRPHAHLARPPESVQPPALRAHRGRGRHGGAAGEALNVRELGGGESKKGEARFAKAGLTFSLSTSGSSSVGCVRPDTGESASAEMRPCSAPLRRHALYTTRPPARRKKIY